MSNPTRLKAYGQNTPLVDVFPFPLLRNRAPNGSDRGYEIGQEWIYRNGDTVLVYVYGGVSSTNEAIWPASATSSGDLSTLEGDTGGLISAVTNNITLGGGTNINTVGTAGTITLNLDPSISLTSVTATTSVSSPLFTSPALSQMNITAPVGNDIVMKLGDSSGNNSFVITRLDDTIVAVFETDAVIFNGLTIFDNGNFSHTQGTFLVGNNTGADAITIGGGSTARAITIGTGSGAHVISIGNSSSGVMNLQSATSISCTAPNIYMNGNLFLSEASKFEIVGGADVDIIGQQTLVAGEFTINNTSISNTDRIFLSRRSIQGSTALGLLTFSIINATSFTVKSVQASSPSTTETGDTSSICYLIIRQN